MHEKKERQEEVRSTESEIGPAGSGSIQGRCTRESAFTRIPTPYRHAIDVFTSRTIALNSCLRRSERNPLLTGVEPRLPTAEHSLV